MVSLILGQVAFVNIWQSNLRSQLAVFSGNAAVRKKHFVNFYNIRSVYLLSDFLLYLSIHIWYIGVECGCGKQYFSRCHTW